jgi:hypothetical protein
MADTLGPGSHLEVQVGADSPDAIPLTPLRAAYEGVRRLSLTQQLSDCTDPLGYPDGLAHDLSLSLEMIRAWCATLADQMIPPLSEGFDSEVHADRVFSAYPVRSANGLPTLGRHSPRTPQHAQDRYRPAATGSMS